MLRKYKNSCAVPNETGLDCCNCSAFNARNGTYNRLMDKSNQVRRNVDGKNAFTPKGAKRPQSLRKPNSFLLRPVEHINRATASLVKPTVPYMFGITNTVFLAPLLHVCTATTTAVYACDPNMTHTCPVDPVLCSTAATEDEGKSSNRAIPQN